MEESDNINALLRDPQGAFTSYDQMSARRAAQIAAETGKEVDFVTCLAPDGSFWQDLMRCTLNGKFSHFRQVPCMATLGKCPAWPL